MRGVRPGDGRTDLVGWASGRLGVDNGMVVLRHRSGWFDDIAAASGAPARPMGPMEDVFPPLCADLDGDGDRDLAVPMGGDRHLGGHAVSVFENLGSGRLRFVDRERVISGPDWVTDVLVGDLDGDGLQDQLHLAPWRGAFVRRGTGGWGGQPVRWGVGPRGGFPEKMRGWIEDLDGDGFDDAVVTDSVHGPRVWRGDPALALADATDALGLVGRAAPAATFVDLDGDGRRDLLGCGEGCWTAVRHGPGFRASDLPVAPAGVEAIVPFDWHADGDVDLLLVRAGDEVLLESRAGGAPERTAIAWGAVARGAAARRPAVHAALIALAAAPWVRVSAWAALAAAFVPMATIDLPPGVRVAAAVSTAVAGLAAWAVARARHRARTAPRIDRYLLEETLGTGGLGTVWAARDPTTGERVAIKVLRPGVLSSEVERELFVREVSLGSEVRDPRLVRLLRWGEVTVAEEGQRHRTTWIAMELLPGATLRERLAAEGPLGAGPACAIGEALCAGLAALHERGIVHGDVKPENVVLIGAGQLKLADFGAARALAEPGGPVLATRGYAPPEQRPGRPPDVRTDVYAVGVLSREAAGDVGPELAAVLDRATAADPAARHPTVVALRADLVRWATAIPEPSRTTSRPRRTAPASGFLPTVDPR